jgi:hypothetical protein
MLILWSTLHMVIFNWSFWLVILQWSFNCGTLAMSHN